MQKSILESSHVTFQPFLPAALIFNAPTLLLMKESLSHSHCREKSAFCSIASVSINRLSVCQCNWEQQEAGS